MMAPTYRAGRPLRGLALFDEARRLIRGGAPADGSIQYLVERGVSGATAAQLIECVVRESLERAAASFAVKLMARGVSDAGIQQSLLRRSVPEPMVARVLNGTAHRRRRLESQNSAIASGAAGILAVVSSLFGLHVLCECALSGLFNGNFIVVTLAAAVILIVAVDREARRSADI